MNSDIDNFERAFIACVASYMPRGFRWAAGFPRVVKLFVRLGIAERPLLHRTTHPEDGSEVAMIHSRDGQLGVILPSGFGFEDLLRG